MNSEIIGIIATVFVLLSFIQKGELRIRALNIIGAILFVVYGVIIGAFSTWLLNGILIIIHLYKLNKLRRIRSEEVTWKK